MNWNILLRSICRVCVCIGLWYGGVCAAECGCIDDSCIDCENKKKVVVRANQFPDDVCSLEAEKGCYHTGYVQALLDMHFLDNVCQVIVDQSVAYLFHLPTNQVIADSIIDFVKDLPFISTVKVCEGSYDESCQKYFANQAPKQIGFPKQRSLGAEILGGKEGIWLPQNTILFAPLVADPRQVTNSAGIRFDDDIIGKRVGSANFGGDFILLRLFNVSPVHGDLDIGIQGGVFSVFDLEHPDACMVNSDFFVSGLLGFAVNAWSYRFRLWHLSTHLGDEFLLSNKDFPRYNLSDEGVDLFVSWRYNPQIRLYGGLGYILFRDATFPEKPFYCEGGLEYRPYGRREANLHAQPIFAVHLRLWEEQHFSIDQNYIIGMEWAKFQDIGRKIRAFFEYHKGFSREGQFVRDRSSYYGFRISYGF